MPTLKAVLFDLDGTLIDSEHFHYECWIDILKEFNVSITYEDWIKNYAGIPLPSNCENLRNRFNLDIPLAELIEWRERLSAEGFANRDIQLMPFASEAITFYKAQGLMLAVVTASPRVDVDLIFNRNGLAHYFNTMVTRTDVTQTKPDPECYLLACERLGIEKQECIVFEDTINGLRAAKAAGLKCLVVQHDETQHEKLANADQIFLDMAEARVFVAREFLEVKQV